MRVFVTGASGFIGSALVPELLEAGHQVVGLARSDASAEALIAAGAEVRRGDLDDLDSLRAGAEASDGVVHLAYIHDFSQMEMAAAADRRAIDAFGQVLDGSERPLVIASGTLGLAPGRVATERDMGDAASLPHPRRVNAEATLALADKGVRSSIVRLAPTVHDRGDTGFIATLIAMDREHATSGYIGDGSNRWPAVHRLDAARLFRLAVEEAPAGSILHAVGDEGVTLRSVAEVISARLDLPLVSVDAVDAAEHFGWMALFLGVDGPASNTLTRQLLGWEPTHPGLLEDLGLGHYFD